MYSLFHNIVVSWLVLPTVCVRLAEDQMPKISLTTSRSSKWCFTPFTSW